MQFFSPVKGFEVRTLAVGDGAKNVRTIQEGHIGAGNSGREGLQAARSPITGIVEVSNDECPHC